MFKADSTCREVKRMSSENLKRRNHLEPESVVGREIVFDDVDWIRLDQDNVQWQTHLYYRVT
jgi:hypothetical protein